MPAPLKRPLPPIAGSLVAGLIALAAWGGMSYFGPIELALGEPGTPPVSNYEILAVATGAIVGLGTVIAAPHEPRLSIYLLAVMMTVGCCLVGKYLSKEVMIGQYAREAANEPDTVEFLEAMTGAPPTEAEFAQLTGRLATLLSDEYPTYAVVDIAWFMASAILAVVVIRFLSTPVKP